MSRKTIKPGYNSAGARALVAGARAFNIAAAFSAMAFGTALLGSGGEFSNFHFMLMGITALISGLALLQLLLAQRVERKSGLAGLERVRVPPPVRARRDPIIRANQVFVAPDPVDAGAAVGALPRLPELQYPVRVRPAEPAPIRYQPVQEVPVQPAPPAVEVEEVQVVQPQPAPPTEYVSQ